METIHEYLDQFEATPYGGYSEGSEAYTFVTSCYHDTERGILFEHPGHLNYLYCNNKDQMEETHLKQLHGITGVMQGSGLTPKVRVMTSEKHDGQWLFTRMVYEKVN